MPKAIAIFISLSCLAFMFVAAAGAAAYRLAPEPRRWTDFRWLVAWFLKGCGIPVLVWSVMNLGVSFHLQPFMPEIQAAQISGANWVAVYLAVLGYGLFVVSSYWGGLTLGWMVWRAGMQADGEVRKDFKGLCLACGLGLLLPGAIVVALGGWSTLGLAANIILVPLAGYAPGVLHPRKLPPMYARAVARIKFGKYSEAEWEIIRQLEKCEDDFDGWMMLAELYANQFNDLREAEQTVLEICDQPRTTPSQLSVALHRLADWYLKLAQDPDAARRALQMIRDRAPHTHLARMAELRMSQLPATSEELKEQQAVKPIPLPALSDTLDFEPPPDEDRNHAAAQANRCVERLKQDPNNPEARERLARLLAEHLDQAEAGIEQIRMLLNLPNQPDSQRAEWLGFIAAWQIRYLHDAETGQKTLRRIVEEFPQSSQAFAAERRLRLFREEEARRIAHPPPPKPRVQ